jgi:hypothetical protein
MSKGYLPDLEDVKSGSSAAKSRQFAASRTSHDGLVGKATGDIASQPRVMNQLNVADACRCGGRIERVRKLLERTERRGRKLVLAVGPGRMSSIKRKGRDSTPLKLGDHLP